MKANNVPADGEKYFLRKEDSPVNGMHMITNIRSLMAKFIIKMLVVERISGLKATTEQKRPSTID